MERRDLLKGLAAGAVAAGVSSLVGCSKSERVMPTIDLNDPSVGQMTYRVNPKNGDRISIVGYGCMRFPIVDDDKTKIDEEISQILVDEAIRRGVNYFDTAYPYHGGNSETFIGKALKKYPRKSFYLTSKFPTFKKPTYEEGVAIFEEQLQKCQVEYFDYYLLHNLQKVEDFKLVYEENGLLDYLIEQKKKGRIRNLGWSFHGNKEMFDYVMSKDVDWDVVLIQINYMDWEAGPDVSRFKIDGEILNARTMYERLTERGIPVIVMEPLLGGRLAMTNRDATAKFKSHHPEDSPAKWAFRFVGSLPNVLTILSGMTYMEHLVENTRSFSPFVPLDEDEKKVLDEAAELQRKMRTINCTTCAYCMPCPYGLNIPGIFAHYNKMAREENIPGDKMHADYAKARKAFLRSYDKMIPELRQADKCIECRQCVPICPQMIPIPTEMLRIAKLVESLR